MNLAFPFLLFISPTCLITPNCRKTFIHCRCKSTGEMKFHCPQTDFCFLCEMVMSMGFFDKSSKAWGFLICLIEFWCFGFYLPRGMFLGWFTFSIFLGPFTPIFPLWTFNHSNIMKLIVFPPWPPVSANKAIKANSSNNLKPVQDLFKTQFKKV